MEAMYGYPPQQGYSNPTSSIAGKAFGKRVLIIMIRKFYRPILGITKILNTLLNTYIRIHALRGEYSTYHLRFWN